MERNLTEEQIKKVEKLAKFCDSKGLLLLMEMEALKNEIYGRINAIQLKHGDKGDKGDKGDRGEKGERGNDGKDGATPTVRELLKLITPLIPDVQDGRDGKDGKDGKDADATEIIPDVVAKIIELLPSFGKEFRDGLELLEGEQRLDASAIKNLEALIKKLVEKEKFKTVYVGGGNSSGGRIVRSYDLSAELDGVTKTFNLPAMWRVISVHSTSFPFTFRETVDYTFTQSTITFTDEITAGTTLASGQTVTIVYSEA